MVVKFTILQGPSGEVVGCGIAVGVCAGQRAGGAGSCAGVSCFGLAGRRRGASVSGPVGPAGWAGLVVSVEGSSRRRVARCVCERFCRIG